MIQGHRKLLVKGGLHYPRSPKVNAEPLHLWPSMIFGENPLEVGEEVLPQHSKTAQKMTLELLKFITGATLET